MYHNFYVTNYVSLYCIYQTSEQIKTSKTILLAQVSTSLKSPQFCHALCNVLYPHNIPDQIYSKHQLLVQQRVLFPCFQLWAALCQPLCPLCRRLAGEQRVTRPGWQPKLLLLDGRQLLRKRDEKSNFMPEVLDI